jgi:hypothetical protein
LFVPDGDPNTVKAAVVSLQSRLQFGAIFVSDKYGDIAGTLPMSLIKTENTITGRGPDIIVSFTFDEKATVTGRPGISYASSVNRGATTAVFANRYAYFMMAYGPSISGLNDTLPTANVDIAPTVARVLNSACRVQDSARGSVGGRATHRGIHGAGQNLPLLTKTGLQMKLPTISTAAH